MARFGMHENYTEANESDQDDFSTYEEGEEVWHKTFEDHLDDPSLADLSLLLELEHHSAESLPEDIVSESGLITDEPEPLAEYDSELSEPLYEISFDRIDDLERELRIDHLVAFIDDASNKQRILIAEMLRRFGNAKLRNWIVWLSNKEWTGNSLLLFLEFFNLWYENSQWWEYWYWDKRLGWLPGFSRHILTRDEAYQWVQRFPHCGPNELVDESWYEDWELFEVWRYGFDSFIAFVRFRFDLDEGEEWRHHLSVDDYAGDKWWDDDSQRDLSSDGKTNACQGSPK